MELHRAGKSSSSLFFFTFALLVERQMDAVDMGNEDELVICWHLDDQTTTTSERRECLMRLLLYLECIYKRLYRLSKHKGFPAVQSKNSTFPFVNFPLAADEMSGPCSFRPIIRCTTASLKAIIRRLWSCTVLASFFVIHRVTSSSMDPPQCGALSHCGANITPPAKASLHTRACAGIVGHVAPRDPLGYRMSTAARTSSSQSENTSCDARFSVVRL